MGTDAQAGELVEVDMGTGLLMLTRMEHAGHAGNGSSVPAPAGPPPGLLLRAIAAGWADTATERGTARGVAPVTDAIIADCLRACAGQLSGLLDMIGTPDYPSSRDLDAAAVVYQAPLDALVQAWRDQAQRARDVGKMLDEERGDTLAACADMLVEAMQWNGEG